MPALNDILTQKLQILEGKHQKRSLTPSFRHDGVYVTRAGKELLSFSCNDYLGLARHPRVIAAAAAALEKYGSGAGASRLVTGDLLLYGELEKLLAGYKDTESAVVFGSGYLANAGTIPALMGRNDLILIDKLSHACIIDGAKLSGATVLRFAHNSTAHCRMLLENNRAQHQNCLIITEEVFSMDGDTAPLSDLSGLAREYDAWFMTDGAHSLLKQKPGSDIRMGTLSKAFGSYGGYVCGPRQLTEYLKNAARSLVFSTGLPPASLAAAIQALKIINEEPDLVRKSLENAALFTGILGLPPAQSSIVPLILEENGKALAASAFLMEKGFLVSAIRPPTVPENTARLRFSFSALHTREQVESLCNVITEQGWV